jgi:hypothetical protein
MGQSWSGDFGLSLQLLLLLLVLAIVSGFLWRELLPLSN